MERKVLSFDKTDVVSDNFLLERTRLFGLGDGDIILLSNSVCRPELRRFRYIRKHIKISTNKEQSSQRTGSVWSLEGDLWQTT